MTAGTADAGWRIGPARTALNHSDVSIHDPEHARKLGFRGAAVGGNIHLDIFAPLLVEAYGPAWFERGALSVYFHNIVVSGEPVQAMVRPPQPAGSQTEIRARRADAPDIIVCAGTASVGGHGRSELATRDLKTCHEGDLRMLRGVKPGQSLGRVAMRASQAEQEAGFASGSLNEPIAWYRDASPWGGPIASVGTTASLMFRLLVGDGTGHHHERIAPTVGDASGMFGAFEIAYVNGPVFLERDYLVEGVALGVGESPKTEYLWWDATARDAGGRTVARMRHLLRFLKASSPLYPELNGAPAA